MVSRWCRDGVEMVSTWCRHGVDMVSSWCRDGVDMVSTWCRHGVGMVSAWCRDGVGMVSRWCRHGVGMVSKLKSPHLKSKFQMSRCNCGIPHAKLVFHVFCMNARGASLGEGCQKVPSSANDFGCQGNAQQVQHVVAFTNGLVLK